MASLRGLGAGGWGLVCLVVLAATPAAAAVSVRAELDRTEVAVGQPLALTITIEGSQNAAAPAIEAADGLTVRYIGPSTQVSFVNGQMTASVSHRYSVVPGREGTFSIGPFAITVDGEEHSHPALRLKALPAAQAPRAQPGREQIELEVGLPRRRVYLQEPMPVSVTLYVGNVRVEDLQYPTLPADGFTLERFGEPRQSREVRDGRSVTVVRFETRLVPLRPGIVNVGPARAQMSMVLPRRGGRGDPFFGGLFGDFQKEPIEVVSDAVPLEVVPLPEEGKPADFGGAIGRFTFEATASPSDVRVGDPITVRMAIAGEGNLAAVGPPPIAGGADFKLYPAQEAGGTTGEKIFEQVAIPLRAEVAALPALSFTYFDTANGRYETIRRGPFPLAVRPAEGAQEPRIVGGVEPLAGAAKPEEKLGRDIVYIKDAPGALVERGQRYFSRAAFWLALFLPPLAYAGVWVWARQRDRLRRDPRYARFARAGREATAALAAARGLLDDGQRFDDALSRALRDYLAAKLDLPPGAIEAENVARRLAADGGAPETSAHVERVLGTLERARYAPNESSRTEREEALRLAEQIVAALEKQRYQAGRIAAALALAAIAALAPNAPAEVGPETSPVAAFYEGNSLYGKGDFDGAAAAYESILAAGVESPAVYFNLGNAYMKAGRPGRAILNYERARRLAPGDADVATNASFALDEQKLERDLPLWQRLAFPLGERLASGVLAGACALLWIAIFAALGARLAWPAAGGALARVAAAAALLLAVAGASLAYRAWRYDLADDVVVTRDGETAVRFEPSDDGTTHFSVAEGTLLHVLESRGDWLQVARDDGRRGWIEGGACERL